MNNEVLVENIEEVNVEVEQKEVKKQNKFLSACSQFFKENWKAYLFMLPVLFLLILFTLWPIINAFRLSFLNDYNYLNDSYSGIGFKNYGSLFANETFIRALANTFWYTFVSVPISLIIALLISISLTKIKFLNKVYETLFFLPHITNAIAMGIVFSSIFLENGVFNSFIKIFGIGPINFISPGSSLGANRFVVILFSIWTGLPFKIIILYSAIQSVPKHYYDAAKIDGASSFRTLMKITVPAISPMLLFLLITGFINGFKEYHSVVGIFGSRLGPLDKEAITIVGFIYEYISTPQTFFFAATASVVLFLIILVVTGCNWLLTRKRVHY